MIWGAASIVVGAALLFAPVASALLLITLVAVFWLIGGIVDIVSALTHRGHYWGWHVAAGALGVIAAFVVITHPLAGTVVAVGTLYLLIASSALVSGIVGIFTAKRSMGRIVLSLLQAVLAVLMLVAFFDLVSLMVLVQAIGLLTIGGGIAAGASAFHFRHSEAASL